MNKLSKNEEIEKLKKALIDKIKKENDSRYINLSSDEIMKIIINSSNNGKYVLWVLREYLKGNIQRFEDMGRCKQALTLFKNNLSKFTEQQKQLNKMSFQELESLVEPYQDVLTQNEIKRMNKEKIWSEIDVIYEGVEGRIYIPKTKEAAIFLGQGTRWCTAAVNNNMFDRYNNQGPLYVFIMNEKDREGREEKYQLHFEMEQLMDAEDSELFMNCVEVEPFKSNINFLFGKIFEKFSDEKKLIKFLSNDLFFSIFDNKAEEEFDEFYFDICLNRAILSSDFHQIEKKTKTEKDFLKLLDFCSKNGRQIDFLEIPNHLKTEKLCKEYAKKYLFDLDSIPSEYISKEFCLEILKNYKKQNYKPYLIYSISKMFWDDEICSLLVEKNPKLLEYIPHKYKSYDLCKLCIELDPSCLRIIPENMRTREICEIAINSELCIWEHVPKHIIDKDFLEKVFSVKEKNKNFETGISKYIPDNLKNYDMCLKMAEEGINGFENIPTDILDQNLCNIIVKKEPLAFGVIPEEFRTKELCEFAVSVSETFIKHVPKKFLSYDMYKILIGSIYSFELIPEEHINFDLLKIGVQKNSSFIRNILAKYLYKKLLVTVEQGAAYNEIQKYLDTKYEQQNARTQRGVVIRPVERLQYPKTEEIKIHKPDKNVLSKKEILDLVKISVGDDPILWIKIKSNILKLDLDINEIHDIEIIVLETLAKKSNYEKIQSFSDDFVFRDSFGVLNSPNRHDTEYAFSLVLEIIEKNGSFLQKISVDDRETIYYLDNKIFFKAVKNNSLSFKSVPQKFITRELCEMAVNLNPLTAEFLSEEYGYLVKNAVKNDIRALNFVRGEGDVVEYAEVAVDELIKKNGLEKISHIQFLENNFSRTLSEYDSSLSVYYKKILCNHYLNILSNRQNINFSK